MKNIILIGATGTIGSAVEQHFSAKEYNILATSRKATPGINIDKPDSIEAFFTKTRDVDAIICVAGNASFGAFSQLTDEEIKIGLNSKLMGQVNICRYALDTLSPNGVIILTGGIFAHHPWPKTSNIAMVNAGLEGFVKALALELTGGRRVLVVHPPLVKETAQSMGMDGSQCPTAREVAYTYLKALESKETGKAIFWGE